MTLEEAKNAAKSTELRRLGRAWLDGYEGRWAMCGTEAYLTAYREGKRTKSLPETQTGRS